MSISIITQTNIKESYYTETFVFYYCYLFLFWLAGFTLSAILNVGKFCLPTHIKCTSLNWYLAGKAHTICYLEREVHLFKLHFGFMGRQHFQTVNFANLANTVAKTKHIAVYKNKSAYPTRATHPAAFSARRFDFHMISTDMCLLFIWNENLTYWI